MKIIVTGGAGFIGSHLIERLLKKFNNIVVIDNLSNGKVENLSHIKNKIKIVKSDLSKLGKWTNEFKQADIVFHLAALADIVPSINEPDTYFYSNVNSTLNVLMTMKKYNVRKIIYTASSSCYGIPDKFPTNEKQLIKPQYPYALTKWLAEEMIIHWSKVYKIDFTSFRLFNVYGPRSRTSGTYGAVFGVFLAQKLNNLPFTIVGDGNQKRDFTYVLDVVNALYCGINKKAKNKIYNVGSGKTVSINKITKLLKGKKIYIPKRPGEPDITHADIKKIKTELNWYPKIDINRGIKIMLKNIDYWSNAPTWTAKKIERSTKNWFKYLK